MKDRLSFPVILLLFLALEKFVQHMFVTYAFFVDLGGIRQQVSFDYRIFMISGFFAGLLFLTSFVLVIQRNRLGLSLLLGLALFDFFGEFVAQGTLCIQIPLSFLVASLIILVMLVNRKSLIAEEKVMQS